MWTVVFGALGVTPQAVTRLTDPLVTWQEKIAIGAVYLFGAAVLFARRAAELAAQNSDRKTAAVASAAMPETAGGAEVLNAVRDSTEPGRP
jgi:hypothetical protein